MPDFGALEREPQFEVVIDEEGRRVIYRYGGYFTNGTTVRYGYHEDYAAIDETPNAAFYDSLQTKAYQDAFPLPP